MRPDEAWRAGRAAYERGDYFEAHEHWEAVWRAASSSERRGYQGLIQLAASCYKLQHNELRPARKLLSRAIAAFEATSSLPEVDVTALASAARDLGRRLDDLGPAFAFDPSWVPRLGPDRA